MANIAAELFSEVLNPFAGTSPGTPTDTPASWMALAAVRREITTASSSVVAVTSGPIVYVPVAEVVTDAENPLAGVITSSVQGTDANGLPLAYAVVSVPSAGGKVNLNPTTGTFAFLPDASVFTSPTHSESFSILVHEVTPFVSALAPLEALPIVGTFVDQTLTALYQVPVLNTLLVPLIGNAVVTPITVDVDAVNPSGNPIAFTTKVISFDGTPISTNFFPALGLQTGQEAPTLLNGPGLGGAGNTDPTSVIDVTTMVPGLPQLRAAGYNVVTWDPRGEFASGGVLQLDSPAFEGKDVQAIIDWVAQQPETQLDSPGDPRMGMVGGSYGGGIQLVTAAIDDRVDAIVPTISWNSLTDSLYPKQTFLTSFGTLLVLSLVQAGAQHQSADLQRLTHGRPLGLTQPQRRGIAGQQWPGSLVSKITAPTLLIQGTVDDLFPLQQAIINQQLLAANGIPVKMIWFCGGHGVCLDPGVDPAAQASTILDDELAWVNQYVKEDSTPADAIPTFQWIDQNGMFFSSNVMPSDPAFQGNPITASNTGGTLPIVPLLGGSGPADPASGGPAGSRACPRYGGNQCAEPQRAGGWRDPYRGRAGADAHLFRHRDKPRRVRPDRRRTDRSSARQYRHTHPGDPGRADPHGIGCARATSGHRVHGPVWGRQAYPPISRLGYAIRESHFNRGNQRFQHDAFAADRRNRCRHTRVHPRRRRDARLGLTAPESMELGYRAPTLGQKERAGPFVSWSCCNCATIFTRAS